MKETMNPLDKFKVGQLVAVYTDNGRFTGLVRSIGSTFIYVNLGLGEKDYAAYPQQLRRIIKKKRREVWALETHHGALVFPRDYEPPLTKERAISFVEIYHKDYKGVVHFVEAKP